MVDDRVVMVSSEGYKNLLNPEDGKGLHWTCDIKEELPIKMRSSGVGSERPFTVCQMFMNAAASGKDRASMFIERDNKKLVWTWKDYNNQVMAFSKACHHLGASEKSAVAIMGFNAPEWAIACMGAIMNN